MGTPLGMAYNQTLDAAGNTFVIYVMSIRQLNQRVGRIKCVSQRVRDDVEGRANEGLTNTPADTK
jgi:hypothetical protein